MFKILKQICRDTYRYSKQFFLLLSYSIGNISVIIFLFLKKKATIFISERPNLETKLLEIVDTIEDIYTNKRNFVVSIYNGTKQFYEKNRSILFIRITLTKLFSEILKQAKKHSKYLHEKIKKIKLYKFKVCIIIALFFHISVITMISISSYSHIILKKKITENIQNFVIIDSIYMNNYSNFLTDEDIIKEKKYSPTNSVEEPVSLKEKKDETVVENVLEYTLAKQITDSAPPKLKPIKKDTIVEIPQKKPQKKMQIITSVLKSIEGEDAITSDKSKEPIQKPTKTPLLKGKNNNIYNESPHISATIIESIRGQFLNCWTIPSGGVDLEFMTVSVLVSLDINANVKSIKLLDEKRYKKNSYYTVMAESVVRAIYKCSPLHGLKSESYKDWKEIEMIFDPIDMF